MYRHLLLPHAEGMLLFAVLAVMRLTKPSLMSSQRVLCDPRDLLQDSLTTVTKKDLGITGDLEAFALGELLTLPQNFGYDLELLTANVTRSLISLGVRGECWNFCIYQLPA